MTPRTALPPRLLPILYFAAAHLALATACAALAFDPRGAAGFFYHARMVGLVHLITLGWITSSILGSLYLVGPIALRVHIPAGRTDYAAFGLVVVGGAGMVAHFWLEAYSGMAWSAATVAIGILVAGVQIVRRIVRAPLPRAIVAHVVLAFTNIAGAAAMGVLLGFDKTRHFLPGFVLSNVFAHAHLAAIGWAALMVVGVAYRLLPMVLPSEMPAGARLWWSAALLEAGAVGLFATLAVRSAYAWIPAALTVSGVVVFLSQVGWMFRHPRPRPSGVRTPDPAVAHAALAFGSLAVASALGLWLVCAPLSSATLRVAMAYGVFGLVGFLAQIVVGMEGRLLPLFAWYWAYANTGYKVPPPSVHTMAWRGGQELVFALWLFGVPALAGGLAFDAVPFVAAAAWALLAATVLDSIGVARILRHAFRATTA